MFYLEVGECIRALQDEGLGEEAKLLEQGMAGATGCEIFAELMGSLHMILKGGARLPSAVREPLTRLHRQVRGMLDTDLR
jgi:hypothetical protein